MPDSPQPVPRHSSTSPKTPASSPPLTADIKPSPSSKAASPTASPSLPNSWHNAQVRFFLSNFNNAFKETLRCVVSQKNLLEKYKTSRNA